MTPERLDECKKICACVPFINNGAGVEETQAAMRELLADSDRLAEASMPADTRASLCAAVLETARDRGICWKPRLTAVTVLGESEDLRADPLALAVLFDIVFDHTEHPDVRARAEEVLESM